MAKRVTEFLAECCGSSVLSQEMGRLSPLLPLGEELLDADGFGLHSCSAGFVERWRDGESANMVLPLARWHGLYERNGFGLYLHPSVKDPLFVLWSDESGECVCLGTEGPLALLAFICTSELGNLEDKEQDQLNISSRQRYWAAHGASLVSACADPAMPRAFKLLEAADRHCFGDAGNPFSPGAAWGFLGRLQSKILVPGFVLSAAGFNAREGQLSEALDLLAVTPETVARVLPGHSWLRWVAYAAMLQNDERLVRWDPPDGADWTFGRRSRNRWESAWRAPMAPVLDRIGGSFPEAVGQCLELAWESVRCNDIARAWSLATLVSAPEWTAGDGHSCPASADWSNAIRIRIDCLKRSHWASIVNAM